MSSSGRGRGSFSDRLSSLSSGKGNPVFESSSSTEKNVTSDSGVVAQLNITKSDPPVGICKITSGRGFSQRLASTQFLNKPSDAQQSETKNLGQNLLENLNDIVIAEKNTYPPSKKGSSGLAVKVFTNYIPLNIVDKFGIYEYHVTFEPVVVSQKVRFNLLSQHENVLGKARVFNGMQLSLPFKLNNDTTELKSQNPSDQSDVKLNLKYRCTKSLDDSAYLYNNLFDRIMKSLMYVRFDRKQFDPTNPQMIPSQKLEIWPGFVTAVKYYESGLMLCLDTSHRLLSQMTVLQKMTEIYNKVGSHNFRKAITSALLGIVVITRYNNRTYRIDDIKFDCNPTHSFDLKSGEKIVYKDYYYKQYGLVVTDLQQPLLVNYVERRIGGKEDVETVTYILLPEFTYLTGFTDDMRKNTALMRDVASFTRINPSQRQAAIRKFCQNIENSKEATQILRDWGLSLNTNFLTLEARKLGKLDILFKNGNVECGITNSQFRNGIQNGVLETIDLEEWLLIHTQNDEPHASKFLANLSMASRQAGVRLSKPITVTLKQDRIEEYLNALRVHVKKTTQIVVIIVPTSRDDRYASIKKVCCVENPVPSQIVTTFVLRNAKAIRSVAQNILLQMICKIGGALWRVNIPMKNTMICGIDTFHEKGEKSVAAFVGSLNSTFTNWYSRSTQQSQKEELINGLCQSLGLCLESYQLRNNALPDRLIIYRDGVGDGELKICLAYEVKQMEAACKNICSTYCPKITFVIVQKRVNTRYFQCNEGGIDNPDTGTVLDHTVCKKDMFNFYLVSQKVTVGSVSPSHYVVIRDDSDFEANILQQLTYRLTFMYYNWPGAVNVPACCQYAHKLAYLVGHSIKRQPAEKLGSLLFYL